MVVRGGFAYAHAEGSAEVIEDDPGAGIALVVHRGGFCVVGVFGGIYGRAGERVKESSSFAVVDGLDGGAGRGKVGGVVFKGRLGALGCFAAIRVTSFLKFRTEP